MASGILLISCELVIIDSMLPRSSIVPIDTLGITGYAMTCWPNFDATYNHR